ncbi:hypothetical protein [Pseudobutyrivibrio sp.]|uniref:hypothetical protein n=1 Tax=Pseudobutyrivibrio sp. TaxID=2014367 RepID=UPI001DDE0F82|nr:hypothetical protein [Pseudobutyrivibrio sp.]MBE5911987.1 hypothetical protein [Pseudobutyrivibrio sp.]
MARSVSGDGFGVSVQKPKNSSTLDLFDNLMADTTPAVEPPQKKTVEKKAVSTENKKAATKEKSTVEKTVAEKAAPLQKKKAPAKNSKVVETRYTQPRKSITISVLEDEDMFLRFNAARKGVSRQDLLENLFTDEIDKVNKNEIPSFEEIKPFMKQLKEPTRFTAMLQSDLIEDIKSSASKVGLRPTSWMAYVIHKYQEKENM